MISMSDAERKRLKKAKKKLAKKQEEEERLRIKKKKKEKRKRLKKAQQEKQKKLEQEQQQKNLQLESESENDEEILSIAEPEPPSYDMVVFLEMTSNSSKRSLLKAIGSGGENQGRKVHYYYKTAVIPCSVAVIFSFSNTIISNTEKKPRHLFREKIVKNQSKNNNLSLFVDSDATACYNTEETRGMYIRLALDSIFPDKANYLFRSGHSEDIKKGLKRWRVLCDNKNISPQSWKSYPTSNTSMPILICHQSNSGFLMCEKNPLQWLTETVVEIRKHTSRKIVIRLPQNALGKSKNHTTPDFPADQNIEISRVKSLVEDVQRSMCVVVHSSSAAICPIVEGIALFAMSPKCIAWQVANHDLSRIEHPETPNRNTFFSLLGASHWTLEELKKGDYWKPLDNFLIH